MVLSALFCLALAVPARTFVLTGRVLDAITSQPIPNAKISDDSGAATYSDSGGNYRLTLTKGVQYERAEAAGMYPAWTTTPNRREALVRDFHMYGLSSPTIEGQVLNLRDFRSRPPRHGAEVRAGGRFVLTDTLGHYVLPLPSPGIYMISAWLYESFGNEDVEMNSSCVSESVQAGSHPVVDLSMTREVTCITDAWPDRRDQIARNRWHRVCSEFYLDADYIERVGGLEKAIGDVPGVLIR